MSDEMMAPEVAEKSSSNRWVSGAILIVLGTFLLITQFFDLPNAGMLFLPALGAIFLLWGIFTRTSGLLVPGGILSGIGVGSYLMDVLPLSGDQDGGVFLLSFGAGFALITLLSVIFTSDKHTWALIPGGILAAIGAMILMGGAALEVLETFGKFWPVILIILGLYVIFKRR